MAKPSKAEKIALSIKINKQITVNTLFYFDRGNVTKIDMLILSYFLTYKRAIKFISMLNEILKVTDMMNNAIKTVKIERSNPSFVTT